MVSITYYYRGSRNNIGGTNVAVPALSYIPLQVTEVTSGQQVTVYNLVPTLRGKFAFLFSNIPQFNTNFNGVDLNFTKRMSHRWMAVAGLSLGHNVGDIFGSSLSIAGFSGLTSDLNNPNFAFRNGVMSNDVPVAIKVSGVYQLPFDISISGSAQHFTGFPELTTALVGSNTVKLTQVTQSIVVQPAGTTRAPSVNLLDISLRKTLKRGNLNVEPVMDVFNLFNRATTLSEITQLGPTHDRPLSILQGRLIKLGANVRF